MTATNDPYRPSADAQRTLDGLGWAIADHVDPRPRCSERDALVCTALLTEHLSLAEVGARHGITKERVHQIFKRHVGLSVRDLEQHRASGASPAARDDVLDGLRRIAALPGGSPLTGAFYDKHRTGDDLSATRVIQRFGSWADACTAAGVKANAPSGRSGSAKWSEDDLLAWVRRYLDAEPAGTYAGLAAWLKEHKADGAPSAQTLRNKLGTWREMADAARS